MTPEEKKEYMRQYRERNKDRIAAKAREYQLANSERIKEQARRYRQTDAFKEKKKGYDKKYYEKNKGKMLQYFKDKYLSNPEKVKQSVKSWQMRNKEKVIQYKRNYVANNPGKRSASNANWAKKNPDIRKANFNNRRERKRTGIISSERIKKLVLLQKGNCYYCGKQLSEYGFHVDHIIPLSKGGTNTNDNIQLLCPRCNLSKGSKHPVDFRQSQGFLL